jgi:hypothetical protein
MQRFHEASVRVHDMARNLAAKAPGVDCCKLLIMRWRARYLGTQMRADDPRVTRLFHKILNLCDDETSEPEVAASAMTCALVCFTRANAMPGGVGSAMAQLRRNIAELVSLSEAAEGPPPKLH